MTNSSAGVDTIDWSFGSGFLFWGTTCTFTWLTSELANVGEDNKEQPRVMAFAPFSVGRLLASKNMCQCW